MSGEELYVVLKIGKEKWSQINCCYIVLSGVLLSTLLTVLSLLTILPAISLKTDCKKIKTTTITYDHIFDTNKLNVYSSIPMNAKVNASIRKIFSINA